jgi:hypothetical protein
MMRTPTQPPLCLLPFSLSFDVPAPARRFLARTQGGSPIASLDRSGITRRSPREKQADNGASAIRPVSSTPGYPARFSASEQKKNFS